MKIVLLLALAAALQPAWAQDSQPAAVDTLSPADLEEILPLVREHYIKPEASSELELKRATVQGLLERLGPGAAILQAPVPGASESSAFRSEVLDHRISYVRLGSIGADNVRLLDAALDEAASKSLGALVLDLRATPPGSEFDEAAEVCRRFTPKGKVLFTVRKPRVNDEHVLTSRDEPKFRGVLVVLVDHDSAGNAEVIAAVLRTQAHALVIGQQTKGEAVEFADLPLPDGLLLRLAVAEVALPDSAPVFPGGLSPDLRVEVAQQDTDALLDLELEKGVAGFVFETERPKMNEAALVAGTNPDIEAIQAAQKNKTGKTRAPLRDAVLQRAVDFITTLGIYGGKC